MSMERIDQKPRVRVNHLARDVFIWTWYDHDGGYKEEEKTRKLSLPSRVWIVENFEGGVKSVNSGFEPVT